MRFDDPIDIVPLWEGAIITIALSMLAAEVGYRYGRHRQQRQEKEAPVGAMVAAELGLLAFMLAFTFGLAASRFDDRRLSVLNEANAIGTAYLRAELLREPQKVAVQQLLKQYVDLRLPREGFVDLESIVGRSEILQAQLWAQAREASKSDPTPITATFVTALNDVIDMHETRVTLGLRSRIPVTIWITLYFVALMSMGGIGYHAGVSGTARSLVTLAVICTFTAVLWLVADLDRPREGLLRTSQAPMLDLQRSMSAPSQ